VTPQSSEPPEKGDAMTDPEPGQLDPDEWEKRQQDQDDDRRS
jgi:hypothetical protein